MSAIACATCGGLGESSLATVHCHGCYQKLEHEMDEAHGFIRGICWALESLDTAPIAASVRLETVYEEAKAWLERNYPTSNSDKDLQDEWHKRL